LTRSDLNAAAERPADESVRIEDSSQDSPLAARPVKGGSAAASGAEDSLRLAPKIGGPYDLPRPERVLRRRLIAAAVFLCSAGVLSMAVYLRPDSRGFGTHQQLGFAPCAMVLTTGYPCPTCGMTTAFSYTVRGRWLRAIYAQPSGFLLALGTVATAGSSLWVTVTGRALRWRIPAMGPVQMSTLLLVLLFGGWGIKILVGWIDGSLPVSLIRA
jgi:hypothetical protein